MTTPQVTVVIPAWDDYAGERLMAALASVREQACPVTVLVVDNASRIELPALGDVGIVRLVHRASTGAARNAALAQLVTPYVVFLDADDLLLPGALEALVSGIVQRDAVSAYALSILDDVTGRIHRTPRRVARLLARAPGAFALANTIWSLLPTQGCTIMRVADLRACGGYGDSSHGEDWVLATSLAFRGKVVFGHRPALRYRRREDSPGVAALSIGVLLANARRVRARVRSDPAIPAWARAALPLIAVAQWSAAWVAHPAYRSARTVFVRAEVRLPTVLRPRALRGAWWAFRALGEASRQVRTDGLEAVRVGEPPDVSPAAEAGVTAVLIRTRATCLTRAFVRQSWFAAQGSMRDVVIGVSRADGFAAHAWLDGDPPSASEGYVELTRLRGR